jgi:hypothetical protein
MELVASRSLAELTRDGPLPPQQVVAVGAAVAAALQAAHAAGITHRDVKPGNVLVAHDGRIKLTDFGIARNPADQTLTATGLMLGSPAYIAPEIASGGPVNPASDLWGLGATLFAAVEGRPPYDAGTAMATVAAVVQDEVPKTSCSGPLADVISGLMVKDPTRRMPLSRVRELLGAPPEPAQPILPRRTDNPAAAHTEPGLMATAATPAAKMPRQRSARLAADPGPLPFAAPSTTDARTTRHGRARAGTGHRAALWMLAVLVFLATATTGFTVARIAAGHPALPSVASPAAPGAGPDDPVFRPRAVQVNEPPGILPTQFTISAPLGWLQFREQRTLGDDTSTVTRFVSPDGAEVIAVERVIGALAAGRARDADQYLSTYLRKLAQGLPQLVETQRQRLSGGALEATFRTEEGGELRRTTYLRLMPAKPDLWVVSVTVPTEREAAGRTKLFEPAVATFTPTP